MEKIYIEYNSTLGSDDWLSEYIEETYKELEFIARYKE